MTTKLINPTDIEFLKWGDGSYLSPKARVGSTSELQDSIQENGQIQPITVIYVEDVCYCLTGHHRIVACRNLKQHVRAEVKYEFNETTSLTTLAAYMAASDIQHSAPDVVADQEGRIYGGLARTCKALADTGLRYAQIAREIGIKVNRASGLVDINNAHPSVIIAAAKEDEDPMKLGITVFNSFMRNMSQDEQALVMILLDRRRPTRSNVSNAIEWLNENNWTLEEKQTEELPEKLADLGSADSDDYEDDEPPVEPREHVKDALASLRQAQMGGLKGDSFYAVRDVYNVAKQIFEGLGGEV